MAFIPSCHWLSYNFILPRLYSIPIDLIARDDGGSHNMQGACGASSDFPMGARGASKTFVWKPAAPPKSSYGSLRRLQNFPMGACGASKNSLWEPAAPPKKFLWEPAAPPGIFLWEPAAPPKFPMGACGASKNFYGSLRRLRFCLWEPARRGGFP